MTAVEAAAELVVRDVRKAFNGYLALDRCDLSLAKGEVVALLGPSGCGKSTLLNLIAGFEQPDFGSIVLRGKAIDGVPPHRRNVAMVFQNYALFPHLTVTDNIAYGLKARKIAKAEWRERVARTIDLLKLIGLEGRYPAQLSGGQRQRVAVARAIAIDPDILLLDEAFSALDRNLRDQTQLELSLLLRRLSITTVLVTHDQQEAFALADRIAVMKDGRIAQVGPPDEVYRKPVNSYVLRFLGRSNSLPGAIHRYANDRVVRIGRGITFPLDRASAALADGPVYIHFRAEDIRLSSVPTAVHHGDPATVVLSTSLGSQQRIVLRLDDDLQIVLEMPAASIPNWDALRINATAYIEFHPADCIIDKRESR